MSFLDRSFELHFNERPFLNHFSYLFITKTTKERSRSQSNFSILCRGNIIPKEVRDKETVSLFLESVDQFERILNDSAFNRLERLTTDEIVGTPQQAGLIEKYFSLSQQDTTTLKDIQMSASKMRIGDNTLCVHTLSDVDDLPGSVQTDTRYEKYSTDRSDCRLSFAAPVGLMLSCNHIYNQFLFIDDSAEILQRFEKTARNMHSLSKYSRANQLNKQWIDAYLDEAHSFGLTAIHPLTALIGGLRTRLDAREESRFQQYFEQLDAVESDAIDFKVDLRRGIHLALWHAMAASESAEQVEAIVHTLGSLMIALDQKMPELGWRLVADALAHGARLLCGGTRHERGGNFFQPTVLADVTTAMKVAREETFGPVAPLVRFHSDAEVLALANDTLYGLAAYFYSRDIGHVWHIAEQLEYGMVGINTGLISNEVAPFGGMKASGLGREGSKYGLDEYLEIKYLCLGGI